MMDLDAEFEFSDEVDSSGEPWPMSAAIRARLNQLAADIAASELTLQHMIVRNGWSDPCPFPRFDLFPRLSRLARWMRRG